MRVAAIAAILVLATACTSKAEPAAQADDATTSTVTSTTDSPGSTETTTSTADSTTPTTTATSTTTTTTRPRVTTTTKSPVTTTIPAGNRPPTVEILAPAALSAHVATYDAARKDFGAYVELSASASDPDGDTFEIRWSANTEGSLGSGDTRTVWLSTKGSDAAQPVITATAVDQWGTSTSASVQVIVWIPSDT